MLFFLAVDVCLINKVLLVVDFSFSGGSRRVLWVLQYPGVFEKKKKKEREKGERGRVKRGKRKQRSRRGRKL